MLEFVWSVCVYWNLCGISCAIEFSYYPIPHLLLKTIPLSANEKQFLSLNFTIFLHGFECHEFSRDFKVICLRKQRNPSKWVSIYNDAGSKMNNSSICCHLIYVRNWFVFGNLNSPNTRFNFDRFKHKIKFIEDRISFKIYIPLKANF